MQQRQLRLGDVLDDYCPRERRLTNHVVVAMVGPDVKQTRCSTCDAEHEYKHAKVPRQRRKPESPAALYSQVPAGGPKRVAHDPDAPLPQSDFDVSNASETAAQHSDVVEPLVVDAFDQQTTGAPPETNVTPIEASNESDEDVERDDSAAEEGPVHRPLIRATLPRPEGQAPPARPAPDFTLRQPAGRANRFRPRYQRGPFQGNRSNGNFGGGAMRGGPDRPGGGRPPHGMSARPARRHGSGRKRSK
jgi:hypothetical protein